MRKKGYLFHQSVLTVEVKDEKVCVTKEGFMIGLVINATLRLKVLMKQIHNIQFIARIVILAMLINC